MRERNSNSTTAPNTGTSSISNSESTNTVFPEVTSKAFIEAYIKDRDIGNAKIREIENKVNQLSNKQINIIETLAIFVALFTFVSIEFQVFRNYCDPFAIIGLSLILLGSLLIFITVLTLVLRPEKINLPLIIVWSGIMGFGIIFFTFAANNNNNCVLLSEQQKNEIKLMIKDNK